MADLTDPEKEKVQHQAELQKARLTQDQKNALGEAVFFNEKVLKRLAEAERATADDEVSDYEEYKRNNTPKYIREALKKASRYDRQQAEAHGTDLFYVDKQTGKRIKENPRQKTIHVWDDEKKEYLLQDENS